MDTELREYLLINSCYCILSLSFYSNVTFKKISNDLILAYLVLFSVSYLHTVFFYKEVEVNVV